MKAKATQHTKIRSSTHTLNLNHRRIDHRRIDIGVNRYHSYRHPVNRYHNHRFRSVYRHRSYRHQVNRYHKHRSSQLNMASDSPPVQTHNTGSDDNSECIAWAIELGLPLRINARELRWFSMHHIGDKIVAELRKLRREATSPEATLTCREFLEDNMPEFDEIMLAHLDDPAFIWFATEAAHKYVPSPSVGTDSQRLLCLLSVVVVPFVWLCDPTTSCTACAMCRVMHTCLNQTRCCWKC